MPADSILWVDKLAKKFCTSFRRSLWYGVQDIMSDLVPRPATPQRPDGQLRKAEFWGLQDISFTLNRGEALAIIGDNGAGKSTLLKILNGLIKPDAGQVRIRGRVGALIELGIGLDPMLSGRENIYLRAALLGMSRRQVDPLINQIIDFTGLGEAIYMPVQFYSSGMTARLAYAVAAHLNPDILLVDEVLAVGDLDFQRKCINHMQGYLSAGGSIILVSHAPHHIQAVCQRGLLLEKGRTTFAGTAVETLDQYFERRFRGSDPAPPDAPAMLSSAHPVAIRTLSVRPVDDSAVIQPGSDVSLGLTYQSLMPVENVGWNFFIWNHDGSVCITGAVCLEPVRLLAGTHDLTCRLLRLPLTAGSYLLKATIFRPDSQQVIAHLGWENAPVRLQVQETASHLKNVQFMVQQLVTIEVKWTCQDDPL